MVTVGYDDEIEITNTICNETTKGAFLIRNSWGIGWGDDGYRYLPYKYVLESLAIDWWILLKAEWIISGKFGL